MYSKGIMWLDDCRIPFVDGNDVWETPKKPRSNVGIKLSKGNENRQDANQQGRFTPNLLVCDDMLNDGSIVSDKGTNSRYYDLDLWFDKMLKKL